METNIPGTNLPPQVSIPEPQELPPIGTLLSQAWAVYKQRFWTLAGISIMPALVMIAGAIIVGGSIFAFSFTTQPSAAGPMAIILGIVLFIAFIYASLWSEAAILWNLNNPQQDPGLKASFLQSHGLIGSLLQVNLLTGLAVLGGLILLIVPGIIFALWFSQSAYVVITEKASGTEALKISKSYVKGRTGAVFVRFLVILLISIGVSIVASTIGNIANPQTGQILNNIASFLIGPLVAAYGFALFFYLKKTKI